MTPSSVRWSELTQGGMRSASQTRHVFSSGASRLPCARSASRNSGSPITLLFLLCLNRPPAAEGQGPRLARNPRILYQGAGRGIGHSAGLHSHLCTPKRREQVLDQSAQFAGRSYRLKNDRNIQIGRSIHRPGRWMLAPGWSDDVTEIRHRRIAVPWPPVPPIGLTWEARTRLHIPRSCYRRRQECPCRSHVT